MRILAQQDAQGNDDGAAVARGRDEAAVVKLADSHGRLQLIADAEGEPRIELLDADGQVFDSMPRRQPASSFVGR